MKTPKLKQIKKKILSRNDVIVKGREQRYFNHINHRISSWIVNKAKALENPIIIMEDLRYIIEQTKVRKKQRYIHQTWSFRRLQKMIEYKAIWDEIPIVYVKPQFTSQICPKCLSTNKRIKSDYKCKYCGTEYNADLVGAINITKKFWEGMSFPEMVSINNAIGFSFTEPQTVIGRRAKKSVIREVCNSSHN